MLVLTRKHSESVVVSDSYGLEQLLKVTVLEIRRGKVTLGIEGERDIPVYRSEVWESKIDRRQPRQFAAGDEFERRSSQSCARKAAFAR
jgi:carbon storage regulator CsrA